MMWLSRVFVFLTPRSAKRALDIITEPEDEGFHYQPPPGIPEADLTEQERKLAAEQLRWREKN
jgi:hypothetical protein